MDRGVFIVFLGLFMAWALPSFADTSLVVHTRLGPTQSLFLCGSGDGLTWDPSTAIAGVESSAGSGVWSFQLADGSNAATDSSIEAKLVVAGQAPPHANPVWMAGQNFILNLGQNNELDSATFEFPVGTVQLQTVSTRGLTSTKQIRIYTPSSIAASTSGQSKHPQVIYALDGQNVFNLGTLDQNTWNLNTTVDDLVGRGLMQAVVIVGIDADSDRTNEYTYVGDPTRPGEAGGGGGVFATQTLPDIVNWMEKSSGLPLAHTASYRTILGSSLGGLEAMYAGLTPGGVGFSKVLSLSGSYWWKNDDLATRLPALIKKSGLPTIYLSMGTDEGSDESDQDQAMKGARAIDSALLQAGFQNGKNLNYLEIPGATHTEASWTIRMEQIFIAGPYTR